MKYLLFVLLIISTTSCELELEDLHINKESFENAILRIDGYYYELNDSSELALRYFLYQDGTSYGWRTPYYSSFGELEDQIELGNSSGHQNIVLGWGLFNVIDSSIIIEEYCYGSGGRKKGTALFEGIIFNDTTFKIIEHYRLDDNNEKYDIIEYNETYHFRKYDNKLDSINEYIN